MTGLMKTMIGSAVVGLGLMFGGAKEAEARPYGRYYGPPAVTRGYARPNYYGRSYNNYGYNNYGYAQRYNTYYGSPYRYGNGYGNGYGYPRAGFRAGPVGVWW